jgi:hypothetical protein
MRENLEYSIRMKCLCLMILDMDTNTCIYIYIHIYSFMYVSVYDMSVIIVIIVICICEINVYSSPIKCDSSLGTKTANAISEYLSLRTCPLKRLLLHNAKIDDYECERLIHRYIIFVYIYINTYRLLVYSYVRIIVAFKAKLIRWY